MQKMMGLVRRCIENVPFSLDGLFLQHSGHDCFLHKMMESELSKQIFDKVAARGYNRPRKRASSLYHTKKVLSTTF